MGHVGHQVILGARPSFAFPSAGERPDRANGSVSVEQRLERPITMKIQTMLATLSLALCATLASQALAQTPEVSVGPDEAPHC